jgi:gliding motility-associated-like protein
MNYLALISMKKIFLISILFCTLSCLAQLSKTHYIPPLTAFDANAAGDQYLYISTPNKTTVNYKIIEIGGSVVKGTVNNDNPVRYNIGFGNNTQLFITKASTGIVNNKGYIVEGEDLLYVSIRLNADLANLSYAHSGGLVSKGNSALGKEFRIGAMLNESLFATRLLNFASILATENGTTITISNIPNGTQLTDGSIISGTFTRILNKNQSFVMGLTNDSGNLNCKNIIGALVESDKPVVVNSGSILGTNAFNSGSRDIGFDQIVPSEKTGKEYIFVKGLGSNELERVLLIANNDNTQIYANGSLTPLSTLNKGQYTIIDGSQFINGSLYITTTENVFAYQSVGGSALAANQNMFFVPPINCATPSIVDNIPWLEKVGDVVYNSVLNIVTETGALVKINGINTIASPITIIGKPGFVRYNINGILGNVSVISEKQVYVSCFGTNGAATYGGYYSGFDLKPEIIAEKVTATNSSCIPNVILKSSSLSSSNTFQWYFNGVAIPNATASQYTPSIAGSYQVRTTISACPTNRFVFSDKIPVSECPTDIDVDKVADNTDVDNDNDGILNCIESYGNKNLDLSNAALGTITTGSYTNSYTGTITTSGTELPLGTFTGNADGSFVTEIPVGKANAESNKEASGVIYTMTFAQPISLGVEYVTTANATDLLNTDAEYAINVDFNKTITVLNPSNQLLIDTNYDGVYESDVTEYSSFEIRFRLNSTTPLIAGTGTFKFFTNLTNTISFSHKNLSDTLPNKSTLKFFAYCVPKDSDGDGIADQLDTDSDNDGILDTIEAQGNNSVAFSNSDANKNGLDNAFEPSFTAVDTDADTIVDYLDLDSDNDGILDSVETGIDTDSDSIRNYRDLDSDNDLCTDVIEAGFTDPDGDGKFGNFPVNATSKGLVDGALYSALTNNNYITFLPIVITTQPTVAPTCEFQTARISLVDNGDSYQWQFSTNGTTWNTIVDNTTYSGALTKTLTISSISNAMNTYKYRVQVNKAGNACGLISSETSVAIYPLPVVNNIEIIQCDDDLNLKTFFNLTVKNNLISSNYANENFTYYKSLTGATTGNLAELIATPLAFENINPPLPAPQGIMNVWARVTNKITGCFSNSKLTLKVVASQIPPTYYFNVPTVCDDPIAADGTLTGDPKTNMRDGISSFDLTNAINDIENQLPRPLSNYTIKYYRNRGDALAQNDSNGNSLAIKPIEYSNFRNDIPDTQNIWVRVNNNLTSDCGYGFGDFIKLTVEKLPYANPVPSTRQCDDNQDEIFNFDTSLLERTLLGTNQSLPVRVTYFDSVNNPLKDSNGVLITSPFPDTFSTKSQTIKAVVTNSTTSKCYDETTIQFTVDDRPEASAIPVIETAICDDEADPLTQDRKLAFVTSTFEATILNGQKGMIVYYFDGNGNALPSPLPNPFVTGNQNVKVIVENPKNTTCPAELTIPFIVKPTPKIDLNADRSDDTLICQNNPSFIVQIDAGITNKSSSNNYTYIWLKDGTYLPGENSDTLTVNQEGLYTVEVTSNSGCLKIRTLQVTASDVAKIDSIAIIDMSDTNTVTVNVSGQGDYEFSLDEPLGPFQDSTFFNNVPAGIHDVYINDKNGCGSMSRTIAVVGLPKFFTPNGDGYNDYWGVKGVNATFNSKSIIYIYDRYGKLLKQWVPTSNEDWDGTTNGAALPADDYWYTIKLEDGREAKGHFSLKR